MYCAEPAPVRVRRFDLAGLDVQDFVSGNLVDPQHIEFGPFRRAMILTETASSMIRRARLDGSDQKMLFGADAIAPDRLEIEL